MRVLITGGSGFIGSKILHYFLKKKFNVVCLVNKNKIGFENKNLEKLYINDIIKNVYSKNIDAIIHCGSKTPTNCNNNKKIFDENLDLMKKLLNFSRVKNIKNFIFLSSISVYGTKNVKIYRENNRFNKPDIYGKSKRECEKMLLKYEKQNYKKNFKSISIRLPGVVGLGSHGNFISETTKKIISGQRIEVSNKSSYFNNIVFVDDLAKFVLKIIKKKKLKHKFVNLASNKKIKIADVIKIIYSRFDTKKNIKWIKTKKKSFCIDFSNAVECGYKPDSVKNSLIKFTSDYLNKL